MSDAFYKSSFYLSYLTLMFDGDQLIELLMCCNSVCVSSILFLHKNETLPCASWRPRISLFTGSNMQIMRANQAYKG